MPRTRMKKPAAPSAAPGPAQIRTATSATLEASISRTGWKTSRNCGTAKSNSPWKVESPIRNAPPSSTCWMRTLRRDALRPHLARGGGALHQQDHAAERRHRGAAEQQQVGRPPQRHVLAEDAVPDVVEREAGERDAGADEDQHAAERRLEPTREPQRGRARRLGREEDREQAGEEHAEQADEDEVVRGVGERAGVAARVEVRRDVPVHAEHGDQQRAGEHAERQRAPRRQAGRALGVEAEVCAAA